MSAQPEMTGHQCQRCNLHVAVMAELRQELRSYLRLMDARPGTPLAKAARTKAVETKARIEDQRAWQARHLEENSDDPGRVRKIRGVRPKAQPKPKPERRANAAVIDMAALVAAKAELDESAARGSVPRYVGHGTNTRPATGRCHECERPVSGERRFCGRCMAKRKT